MVEVKLMLGKKNAGRNNPGLDEIHLYYNIIYGYGDGTPESLAYWLDYVLLIEFTCLLSKQELHARRRCKTCWCEKAVNSIVDNMVLLGVVEKT